MSQPKLRSFLIPAVLSLAWVGWACSAKKAPPAPAAVTVSVIEVQPERVVLSSEWVASLDGMVNAQIRPQVSGYLVRARYREGGQVAKGQVLFEIDPRPFAAAVAQAEADLAEKQAELAKTVQDVERSRPLAEQRAIPQSQLQTDIQANRAAEAAAASAAAAVDTAKLQRGFSEVRSLVDGVAGIASAQIGDLVGPETVLTTVSQIDPMRAFFSLSEREYLQVAARLNLAGESRGGGAASLWQGDAALRLELADGSIYGHPGSFLAADNQIDPRTGTIRIGATFPNPEHLLRPGQYGRVRAETGVVEGALLVPQRAVSELQGGAQLRVVDAEGKVHVQPVKLGSRSGNRWIVTEGLTAGAQVIVNAPSLPEGTVVTVEPWQPEPAAGSPATPSTGTAAATAGREGR